MGLWGGRFSGEVSGTFKQVNDSLRFDIRLLHQDIEGSIAWSHGLVRAQVITDEEQQQIAAALTAIGKDFDDGKLSAVNELVDEDIHSLIERLLIERIGDLGKKLHTGRSRNDQVATDFRLWVRGKTDELIELIQRLRSSLVACAEKNQDAVIPGYTHLQRAQPVLFAHWCLAYVEMLKRDVDRLQDSKQRLNHSPLGCGALAGTTFAVERQQIASDLGFSEICQNSLDAVSDRDFVLELLFNASTSMMHLSRMAEDLVFYNSGESGFIEFGDNVTSGSSLMPQKKNPDALELIRGKCGRVFGNLQSLLVTMKGLPLAYNKDMQEDKEGAFDSVEQWAVCLAIAIEVIDSATLNPKAMIAAARGGHANSTELADYLVKQGVPFREAHDITGLVVRFALDQGCAIEDLSLEQLQRFHPSIQQDVFQCLDLMQLIAARNQTGGTSPAQVQSQLAKLKIELDLEPNR